jgi:predicted AAA+ superfamily ATPase
MYVARDLTKPFALALQQFPAVLITGPRQSGKSTFVQHVLSKAPYMTFDDPLNRDFALRDPNGFLDQFPGKTVVLDEIQYAPSILQYIKMRIDKDRKPGAWVLTGSQQFSLMKGITETLAGRIAILELPPFNLNETGPSKRSLEDLLWTGFFPEPACHPEKRDLWLKSYIQTYVERDVRQIENIKDLRAFELFVNLCAAFHSREFHPAHLARDCGVSQPTIKAWSRILEASYLAMMLPPFFKNYGKRIIKTPKFYMTDPSLVCFLTRQPAAESVLRGNMGGAIFEGSMVCEAWKAFLNHGKKPSLFFWRSQSGLEVDMIIQARGKLWPVEIKLTSTPSAQHAQPLDLFKVMAGKESSSTGLLVCKTDRPINLPGKNTALPWFNFPDWLADLIE